MAIKKYAGPMRFAHRGVVQAAPENSLEALQAAVDMGLEGIEIDIRRTSDGELVLIHDECMERLLNNSPHRLRACNMKIADMTWEQLSKIEIPFDGLLLPSVPPPPGPQGKKRQEQGPRNTRTTKLLRLEDMIKWLETQPCEIMVEIECKAPGMIRKLLSILDASTLRERCIVFSGEPAFIEEIQVTCAQEGKPAGLKLGANIRFLSDKAKKQISYMDLYEVGLDEGYVSKEDVEWLNAQGIQAFSNVGDYPGWWRPVCELGMHALKTNYAEAYTNWWLGRFGK